MSDVTLRSLSTVLSVPSQKVRRVRRRRAAPRETGADLLQVSSRLTEEESRVLAHARAILFKLAACPRGRALNSPSLVREYLTTLLSGQDREYFVVLAVDNRHRLVASEILFAGTIDGARVYPREVVRCALRHNAAAIVLAHCHPSGVLEPSQADELITRRLTEALALIDVRVLDHFIVGDGQCTSFSEKGLL
jgi:DNA repair protein RadC